MTRQGIIAALDGTHPTLGRGIAFVIYGLIILSCLVIAVETLPDLSAQAHRLLRVAEFTILSVFVVEYILRLACSPKPLTYATASGGSSTSSQSCQRSCSCFPTSQPCAP
jgi:voltage-gated potassium channel